MFMYIEFLTIYEETANLPHLVHGNFSTRKVSIFTQRNIKCNLNTLTTDMVFTDSLSDF